MAAAVVVMAVGVGRAGLGGVGRGLVVVEGEEPFEEEERRAAPPAVQRSVPAEPISTASGSMWKNAAPSIAPAAKLR